MLSWKWADQRAIPSSCLFFSRFSNLFTLTNWAWDFLFITDSRILLVDISWVTVNSWHISWHVSPNGHNLNLICTRYRHIMRSRVERFKPASGVVYQHIILKFLIFCCFWCYFVISRLKTKAFQSIFVTCWSDHVIQVMNQIHCSPLNRIRCILVHFTAVTRLLFCQADSWLNQWSLHTTSETLPDLNREVLEDQALASLGSRDRLVGVLGHFRWLVECS